MYSATTVLQGFLVLFAVVLGQFLRFFDALQLQTPEKDGILNHAVMNTGVVDFGRPNFITIRSSFPHLLAFNLFFSRRRSLGVSLDF